MGPVVSKGKTCEFLSYMYEGWCVFNDPCNIMCKDWEGFEVVLLCYGPFGLLEMSGCFVPRYCLYWVKASKYDNGIIESQWWSCLWWCVGSSGEVGPRSGIVWTPPPVVTMKLNVDGSSRGKLGPAGCGGVLWDAYSKVLTLFSGPIGVADSTEVELLAVVYALRCWWVMSGVKSCLLLWSRI
ncbi:hypothetical protein GQ457_04G010010 [Hibiscus cannabinus]